MKLLLPDSIELDLALPPGWMPCGTRSPTRSRPTMRMPRLSWSGATPSRCCRMPPAGSRTCAGLQTLAAGADPVLKAGFSPTTVLTAGQTLHDRPVAEHALALVLAAARRLQVAFGAQLEHRWASNWAACSPSTTPKCSRPFAEHACSSGGTAASARTVAPLLRALGATVTGVARTARQDGETRVIAIEEIETELPSTDVLLDDPAVHPQHRPRSERGAAGPPPPALLAR